MIKRLDLLAAAGDLEGLRKALVPEPQPLAGRETIQIILVREVQDYTIFRTEETRELNTVWTPGKSGNDRKSEGPTAVEPIERVAFLATKQKAAESRELEGLLRTWGGDGVPECYLKSALCLSCPRCVLFGATDVSKGRDKGANIKHRIAYATGFSLLPVDPDLRETHTFNGVDEATQLTGSTLGDRESVRPCSLFASIVTLRAVTEAEFVLALKTILSCTRYGAETRIGGFVRNHVVGLVAAQEEILSPLELTLALADGQATDLARVQDVLEDYRKRCATPEAAHVVTPQDLGGVVEAAQQVIFDRDKLRRIYDAAAKFRERQKTYTKKAKEK